MIITILLLLLLICYNVVKIVIIIIINHPPPSHPHFYRLYVYHSQIGSLWHGFNHITLMIMIIGYERIGSTDYQYIQESYDWWM